MEHARPKARQASATFRKEKMGFWCPGDVDDGIQKLIDEGHYQDRSKAVVDLIRKGLAKKAPFSHGVQKSLEKMAAVLERDPDVVLGQCVEGISSLVESNGKEMPIIFEEIKLREDRQAMKESSSNLDA